MRLDDRCITAEEGRFLNAPARDVLEPDGAGHRVRFRTMNGQSRALMFAGLGMMGVTLVTTVAGMLTPGVEAFSQFGTLTFIGVVAFAYGALRLPGWARLRQSQMERLAASLLDAERREA